MTKKVLFGMATGWFGLALLASSAAVQTVPAVPRPNFVVIIADDVGADDLGCFGNPGIRTPNLDRLAAGGMRFVNAYVTASSCSPSRCSIVTSRYPHNNGTASELHGELPRGIPLLPQLLREEGYYTAQAGKLHFGTGRGGPGEEAFDVSGTMPDDEGGEQLWVERLQNRPKDKPFFMWFASYDAHREWDRNPFNGLNRAADVRVPPYLLDTPETRQDLVRYYDEITRLDIHVGQVMAELERQKLLQTTVVVFLSDNGRPFPHSKTQLYDDSLKTPLIIHCPARIAAGNTATGLVSSIDLAPTLLELAGIARPATFQGVSLTPLLRDAGATIRDYIFAEKNWHNFAAHMRMVRLGDFVYIRNAWPALPQPGASDTFYNPSADALKRLHATGRLNPTQGNVFLAPRPAEELYDLRVDPTQEHNIAADPKNRGQLEELREALNEWTSATGDSVPATPTGTNVDYATGGKIAFRRGPPPGESARATEINRPGPVRRR